MKTALVCLLAATASAAPLSPEAAHRQLGWAPHSMTTATELGLAREAYDALPDMPGSQFMRNGFDVTYDSVADNVTVTGQTARLPVYKFTYNYGNVWTDPYDRTRTYKVADQLSATTNTGAMEFIVEDISYHFKEVITYSVQRFNIGISLTLDKISASVNYNQEIGKASDIMSNNSHVFAGSKKWWRVYDLAAYPPQLVDSIDPVLQGVLDKLPKRIKSADDHSKYQMFCRAWGTHYMLNGNFGGKLIHNVYVDEDFYSSRTSSYMSQQISLNFHFDAFQIDGGGFSNRSQIHLDKDYEKHSSSFLFYEGGLPNLQDESDLDKWALTIPQQPHFLNSTMIKISELVSDSKVKTTLGNYIDDFVAAAGNPSKISQAALDTMHVKRD